MTEMTLIEIGNVLNNVSEKISDKIRDAIFAEEKKGLCLAHIIVLNEHIKYTARLKELQYSEKLKETLKEELEVDAIHLANLERINPRP